MTRNYTPLNTRIFIRRLFKQDIDIIVGAYKAFDVLYSNPMTPVFASELLLYGEIWGAFSGDKLVGCCYLCNAEASFFKGYDTYSSIADFIQDMKSYMYLGYIYADKEYVASGIYQAFYSVAQVQSFRQGAKYILHSLPIKLPYNLQPLFKDGFRLIKMRGLDNLVVHYVFVKSLYANDTLYNTNDYTTQLVSTANTKTLSKYLEQGYCGVNILYKDDGTVLELKQLNNL